MTGSTYTPQTWHDVQASAVQPHVIGIQGSIPSNTTANVDTLISDDALFRGIKLIAMNTTFGDTVSVKIVDINGVYSPPGTVLGAPVLNFNISSDQQLQADYESIAPFKILGGLYLRITYVSTGGLLSSVKLGADLFWQTCYTEESYMLADWAAVKSLLTGRSLSAQCVTVGSNYWIKAKDGIFELECLLSTDTSSSPDSLDFATNFLPGANAAPHSNVVQVLGADTLTLCPFGAITTPGQLVASATTTWDIPLPTVMSLRGGKLFSPNSVMGDWITVTVIDDANITGQGGTTDSPTVLGTYIISWYVVPGVVNDLEDVSISQQLPAGVKMRVAYTSTGTVSPQAILNFISYVGTP